jgi:hypothetical protein
VGRFQPLLLFKAQRSLYFLRRGNQFGFFLFQGIDLGFNSRGLILGISGQHYYDQ